MIADLAFSFENPFMPGDTVMLKPEDSMRIQHSIGADIMMQLDDVVASLTEAVRMKEASERSVRCERLATMFYGKSGLLMRLSRRARQMHRCTRNKRKDR